MASMFFTSEVEKVPSRKSNVDGQRKEKQNLKRPSHLIFESDDSSSSENEIAFCSFGCNKDMND